MSEEQTAYGEVENWGWYKVRTPFTGRMVHAYARSESDAKRKAIEHGAFTDGEYIEAEYWTLKLPEVF